MRSLVVILAVFVAAAAGCVPRVEPAGPFVGSPVLVGSHMTAGDGAALPVRRWMPDGAPRAVILAIHGFNDYSNAFDAPAKFWSARGIAVYAYDQRGFGAAPGRGLWAGTSTMVADARAMAELVRARHPRTPLYLVGVSMGGAVALLALTDNGAPVADGAVLVAPAVWGRRHMGAFERGTLWLLAHTMPWYPLTGQGLRITPSDNMEMLRALGRDPLVLKETRIDSVYGLVGLMDAAFAAAVSPALTVPTLVLYGNRDEIVPAGPTFDMLKAMTRNGAVRAAIYPDGYHMLLRDLDAERVLADIAAWIDAPRAPLPSGADAEARRVISGR